MFVLSLMVYLIQILLCIPSSDFFRGLFVLNDEKSLYNHWSLNYEIHMFVSYQWELIFFVTKNISLSYLLHGKYDYCRVYSWN